MATVKARPETIAMPTIVSGNFWLTRSAPQPANVSMYVPTISAIAYTCKDGVGQQTLETFTCAINNNMMLEKIAINDN